MGKLGEQAIGSVVKLNVSGVATNFIVVHHGLPSADYDSTCDGTWLLMEDVYENMKWDSSNSDYANSDIHSYLNNTFVNLFESEIQGVIKQVKIPYAKGAGSSSSLKTGTNGLSAKLFLLSRLEAGSGSAGTRGEGAVLSYFSDGSDSKRIAKQNGTAAWWWLRSTSIYQSTTVIAINKSGAANASTITETIIGVRPVLILPAEMRVNTDGLVLPSSGINGAANIGGTWKELSAAHVNIGGVWKEVSEGYENIGGVWKPIS